MATTFVEYTGDGQASKQFTFPSYQESDVKVRVDGVLKDTSTHYNITNYTTTGGGFVVFTSGNIPSSPANIRIYRDTNVDSAKATFTAGSSVKAADLNNNNTQLLYRAQEEQTPNLIHSYDIDDSAIETSKIKADAVTGAKIADDQINSEHYVDGSIDTAHIADAQITTAKLAADSVTNAKIADDSIDSEHYVDGSIDTAHVADGAITNAKLANDAVGSGEINSNAITTSKISAGAVTEDKIATNAVTSAKIAENAVTNVELAVATVVSTNIANGNITTPKIADSAVSTAKIANSNVTTDKIADSAVTTAKIADSNITNAKLAATAVTQAKIGTSAVATDKIADGAVTTVKIPDNAITTPKIADANITTAKIANNAVTTDKIADSELTTLAGMQSTTASNLASATALTASTAELNQLDGITLETSVTTNSDTRIPTSKAVNDLVLSVTNALGGFVAIANETSFPTTNPDPSNNAGTVVSISQLSTGLAVNSSGVATIANGAGTGNTVTITGFPSNLQSQTLPASSGLQVQTTSTLHTYTFHKQLASAADIQAISATVNSFSNRYRVSASAPTSSLDGGDLWYDTTNSKLMVYSSQNSAWEESSAIGNFFISTISSSSNTGGGSATPNGTAYRFTISDAPVSAQQLLVSVDGVIQKPNSGSSQPSEGFVLVGNDIIFGAAPANGASLFVTVIGSTVGIGTPSNNTVTTAILQNGSVTTAKIVDSNVTTAKIADDAITNAKIANTTIISSNISDNAIESGKIASNAVTTAKINSDAVTTAKIADDAVTAAKLANTSVSAGSYGSSTSIPSITVDAQGRITAASGNTVNTDLVGDTSPQLGGGLESNGFNINFADSNGSNNQAKFGASGDLAIYHDSVHSRIVDSGTGDLKLQSSKVTVGNAANSETMATFTENGAVELYHDNSKKFETLSNGVKANGNIIIPDSYQVRLGDGNDMQIYHDGTNNILNSDNGEIRLMNGSEYMFRAIPNGANRLYYSNSTKAQTTSTGFMVNGDLDLVDNNKIRLGSSQDIQIYHDGSHSYLDNTGGVLHLRSVDDVKIQTNTSELAIKCDANGAVELYNNGNLQMMTIDGGINLQDNKKAEFGNSGDLKIWHDGSHSKISNSTGYLVQRSNQYKLSNVAEDHTYIKVPTHEGGVELYYDNVKKLETTSTGAAINGGRMTSSQPMAAFYGCNNTSGYAGWKTIQWRVQEDRDNINMSNSNSRFTPQVAGWYSCVFNHYHSNGTHSSYYLEIKVYPGSGGSYTPAYQKYPDNFSANISSIIYFNGSSDYVEFRTHHSNTAHNTEDSYLTNMRMVYLSN